MSDAAIKEITAWEILDSRGYPTVEVEVVLAGSVYADAAARARSACGQHQFAALVLPAPRGLPADTRACCSRPRPTGV